jgi:hypothetical protein
LRRFLGAQANQTLILMMEPSKIRAYLTKFKWTSQLSRRFLTSSRLNTLTRFLQPKRWISVLRLLSLVTLAKTPNYGKSFYRSARHRALCSRTRITLSLATSSKSNICRGWWSRLVASSDQIPLIFKSLSRTIQEKRIWLFSALRSDTCLTGHRRSSWWRWWGKRSISAHNLMSGLMDSLMPLLDSRSLSTGLLRRSRCHRMFLVKIGPTSPLTNLTPSRRLI